MPEPPPLDVLRALAAAQGIDAADEDLEAARAFLAVVLPQLEEIEGSLPEDLVP